MLRLQRALAVILAAISMALANPLCAEEPATHYFVFEADEERLAKRLGSEADRYAAIETAIDVAGQRLGGGNFELSNLGEGRVGLTLTHANAPQIARDVFGITAQLDFLLVDTGAKQSDLANGTAPPGTKILPHPDRYELLAVRIKGGISGDRLTDARVGIDIHTDQPVLNLAFDNMGKEQLAAITCANIGRPFAIVLDGEVLSAPTIQEAILEGQLQLSGNFTQEETSKLAISLRSGALPTPFRLVEERVLPPSD